MQAGRQAQLQTGDGHAGRQRKHASKQAGRQAGRQAGMHAHRQANMQSDTRADRHNTPTDVLHPRRHAGM